MTTDLEQKARELLVDAYTKAGATQRAQHIRYQAVDWPDTIAIAAIVAALSEHVPSTPVPQPTTVRAADPSYDIQQAGKGVSR